jgi:protein ImuB
MCSMIVCVLLPRFALSVAAGGRAELARGPVALAPEPGREPLIGEASAAAEAHGVRAGLRLGEALARCPALKLVSPDPAGVADQWDRVLAALEGIGAAVESERAGVACFDASGLLKLHGGLDGVLAVTRRALGVPARLGVAATRFAAVAAASSARARKAEVAPGAAALGRLGGAARATGGRSGGEPPAGGRAARRSRDPLAAYLAPLPITLLGTRAETAALPEPLERFGIRTLGELAALPRESVADRFGAAGLRAHRLATGRDRALRPRRAPEDVAVSLPLPEAVSGIQLERALALLIGRLLAHSRRHGRSFRKLRIAARLAAGGGWRADMPLRRVTADPDRLRLALLPKLGELPGPAERLGLRALALGPAGHDQPSLSRDERQHRRERVAEAVRQARAAGGRDAVLRVLDVDPGSRVPERRVMLTPYPE